MKRCILLCALCSIAWSAFATINVVTQHYDISRTGANTSETALTPLNVHTNTFGKLFSHPVDGYVYAQPLYVAGVILGPGSTLPNTTHNVFFIATENDSVYAFDADNNHSANANPLWHITLLDAAHGAATSARPMLSTDVHTTDIVPIVGITGTPVIDTSTGTIYVVGKTKENNNYIWRLHALSIANGAEKFGGPTVITASVPGNGTGSSAGTLQFDSLYQLQRPGLLLLNGIIYIGFGSHEDTGPWHGWVLAYSASTLLRTGVWCSTPNGMRGGLWGGGSGLAADVPDPVNHPYGRLFISTGNGSYNAVAPNYNNSMNYGDSVVKLDLAGGSPTTNSAGKAVGDDFTPHDQAALDTSDQDQGSGGVLILPNTSTGEHLLVQVGKTGRVYLLNQESLGGYHPSNTLDPEQKAGVGEITGMPAYWNGHIYIWASRNNLRAFPYSNGVLTGTPSSISAEYSNFPGSTPTVSANGSSNGIVWSLRSDAFATQGREVLYAHNAANVSQLLYSSEQNVPRDNPGNAVKFVVPTVANGRVYVGAEYQVSVYGLLGNLTQAASPVISPASESYYNSVSVSMKDATAGTIIHYTTDGSTPTASSPTYTVPLSVTTTETIRAIAISNNYLDSVVASATYTRITQAAMPAFSPAPGTYTTAQTVTIATRTPNATIFYTTDGSTPTTSSKKYAGPVTLTTKTTLKAIATASGLTNSPVASGLYTIP